MSTVQIELPPKLVPVFDGEARYRGAYGGRGSGKTRSFAKMAAVIGLIAAQEGRSGIVLCGREFMNSLDESSLAEIKAAIASEPWLMANYEVGEKYVRTAPHLPGRVDFKFIGLQRNLDSIKSKANIILCWIDEAEPVSDQAWQKLTPTVREAGSEIWVTWNPESERSATHKRFRDNPPEGSRIVEMNYTDNPWFPDVLEYERQQDFLNRPDQYGHIWLGEFRTVFEGAYYSQHLARAKSEGRIGRVERESMMSIRTYHDLAGMSDRADAYAMWVCQFVNKEIRLLDYYETQGQSPEYHINWLKNWCLEREIKRCTVRLPHDGSQVQINQSWENIWRKGSDDEISFQVSTIPNQGRSAAMTRVNATRLLFPKMWFADEPTKYGRLMLGRYHERMHAELKVGLGPKHDEHSHCADAFGLMACDYSETKSERPKARDYEFTPTNSGSGWSW